MVVRDFAEHRPCRDDVRVRRDPGATDGGKASPFPRDKVSAGDHRRNLGALVCGPPHLLNRLAILMLGFRWLFIPGIILLTFGVTLQAGATGAVKA